MNGALVIPVDGEARRAFPVSADGTSAQGVSGPHGRWHWPGLKNSQDSQPGAPLGPQARERQEEGGRPADQRGGGRASPPGIPPSSASRSQAVSHSQERPGRRPGRGGSPRRPASEPAGPANEIEVRRARSQLPARIQRRRGLGSKVCRLPFGVERVNPGPGFRRNGDPWQRSRRHCSLPFG